MSREEQKWTEKSREEYICMIHISRVSYSTGEVVRGKGTRGKG